MKTVGLSRHTGRTAARLSTTIGVGNSDFETPQSTAERAHRMSMALQSEETLSVSLGLGTIKATDTQTSAYGTQHRREPGDATTQVLIQLEE